MWCWKFFNFSSHVLGNNVSYNLFMSASATHWRNLLIRHTLQMLIQLSQTLWVRKETLIEGCAVNFLFVDVGRVTCLVSWGFTNEIEPNHDIFIIRDDSDVPVSLLVVLRLQDGLHHGNRIEVIAEGLEWFHRPIDTRLKLIVFLRLSCCCALSI